MRRGEARRGRSKETSAVSSKSNKRFLSLLPPPSSLLLRSFPSRPTQGTAQHQRDLASAVPVERAGREPADDAPGTVGSNGNANRRRALRERLHEYREDGEHGLALKGVFQRAQGGSTRRARAGGSVSVSLGYPLSLATTVGSALWPRNLQKTEVAKSGRIMSHKLSVCVSSVPWAAAPWPGPDAEPEPEPVPVPAPAPVPEPEPEPEPELEPGTCPREPPSATSAARVSWSSRPRARSSTSVIDGSGALPFGEGSLAVGPRWRKVAPLYTQASLSLVFSLRRGTTTLLTCETESPAARAVCCRLLLRRCGMKQVRFLES